MEGTDTLYGYGGDDILAGNAHNETDDALSFFSLAPDGKYWGDGTTVLAWVDNQYNDQGDNYWNNSSHTTDAKTLYGGAGNDAPSTADTVTTPWMAAPVRRHPHRRQWQSIRLRHPYR